MDLALSEIRGIGPKRLEALNRAGITSVRKLLMCLPREYQDMNAIRPLAEVRVGETCAVSVRVTGTARQTRFRGLTTTRVYVTDETETLEVVWYNQPWLQGELSEGRSLLLYGRFESRGAKIQLVCPSIQHEVGLVPVYRNIAGVPGKAFRAIIQTALKVQEGQWPDELPEALRRRYGLCERNFAMRCAHMPESMEALTAARRRLSFEELLCYQVALGLMRSGARAGVAIPASAENEEAFWHLLPFPPTGAQRRVFAEIAEDLSKTGAMARLVQGDVGSGKTALAFGAIFLTARAGWQSALMAPTEILARQHYESAKALFEPLGIHVGLLVGSLTAKQKKLAHAAIASGEWAVAIGTHALISEGVAYAHLGLVVTDEQHRFGVRQRTMLSAKGDSPNVLVMSATPIPRTLSLILYGDLDISIVDELPPGRTPVATRIVSERKRAGMYGFIREEVRKGRQAYVVCPLVEESEALDAVPAEAVYEKLRTEQLADLRIALVHGRMKSADKERVIEEFRTAQVDVLVSTTVIEVGVNVPNATVMVIENAERFGLAQLHQLRGRVGRGAAESWCFLMADPNERLRLLTETNDGFIIAQKDMELRGPGELFGTRQSGDMALGLGGAMGDVRLLQETHDAAREILRTPDAPDSCTVIALAREAFRERMDAVAMN